MTRIRYALVRHASNIVLAAVAAGLLGLIAWALVG
jgi:hypothetical protein